MLKEEQAESGITTSIKARPIDRCQPRRAIPRSPQPHSPLARDTYDTSHRLRKRSRSRPGPPCAIDGVLANVPIPKFAGSIGHGSFANFGVRGTLATL